MATPPATLIRALRLPFLSASVLPYLFGSLLDPPAFSGPRFVLGLVAVAATHLGANLLNDYADSQSGADSRDPRYYGFFGGSKLIQEGVLSPRWFFRAAQVSIFLGSVAVGSLAVQMRSVPVLLFYLIIVLLAWAYSLYPFRLSYRRLGEFVVFLLFGPAAVMGGYFIQTGLFPTLRPFVLSLPFGLLTASILIANEVPDAADDTAAGKYNLVGLTGPRNGFLLYAGAVAAALACVLLAVAAGLLHWFSLAALLAAIPAAAASRILRRDHTDKLALVAASKLAIFTHAAVSVILLIDAGFSLSSRAVW